MKKIKLILSTLILLLLVSCGVVPTEKGTLTDDDVLKYCKVYKDLKTKAPGVLQTLNERGNTEAAGVEGFKDFEGVIKSGGIEDYKSFVLLNAKIGAIFSIMQGEKGMETFKNMESSGQNMMADGIKIIQEQIENPDVPEATKVELRKQIEEMKKGSQEIKDTYANNMKWANLVMDNVGKVTGLIVNEKDVEVVKKHESEIYEAYTGFPQPAGADGKLPPLKWD